MGDDPRELYCKVLGVEKDASLPEIRSAYRNLVKKWHPDKHPASSKIEAEARFKSITQAYEALTDEKEMIGSKGMVEPEIWTKLTAGMMSGKWKQQDVAGTPERENIKGVCYTAGNMVGNKKAVSSFSNSILRKPPPVEKKLECSLEELCYGCRKEVSITRGIVDARNGSTVKKEERLTVLVKPGYRKGKKVAFPGMGGERPGWLPADLVVVISEKKHAVFKRVGDDLVLKVEVPLVAALTGWSFSFKTLSGEKMKCSFHDEIIRPGQEKVFPRHGMPIADSGGGGGRGDLRVKFEVVFPTKLSREKLSALAELLKECY